MVKSNLKLIGLHIIPGLVMCVVFYLVGVSEVLSGYPNIVVAGICAMMTLVPIELGILLYVSKKENGDYNILNILGYKEKLGLRKIMFYVVGLFALLGALATIMKPVSDWVFQNMFERIPEWMLFTEGLDGYSQVMVTVAISVSFLVFTIIGPVVEELYFRGFLLARMDQKSPLTVIFHTTLFAIYHFWSLWLIPMRIVLMTPLYTVVKKKRSLMLGIVVHCLVNLTDVVLLLKYM